MYLFTLLSNLINGQICHKIPISILSDKKKMMFYLFLQIQLIID